MKNFESSGKHNGKVHEINGQAKGREAISVERALEIQGDLIWYITPPEILSLISEDRQATILEALTMRYLDKYAAGKFNGFAEYCDNSVDEERDSEGRTFVDRVVDGFVTTEDFTALKNFLEQHPSGGPFFASAAEIENFIAEYSRG